MAGLNNIREAYEQVYAQVDEAIRNPESRKKLNAIFDKEVRKGDKSKGENPRSKYSTEKGKQAFHLLHDPEATGSKGNPVRSRGGTNAPADERVGRGPHRAGNAAYWAGNAGPNRDRGAGNKAARRAGRSVPNTRDMDENYDTIGLDSIRRAYEQVYAQVDEALSADEKALRRELARDKKASKMAPSVAAKYAGSEAQSAARADKKSRGKHIHGMADSYEVDGDIVDETTRKPSQIAKRQKLTNLLQQIQNKNEKARKDIMATQAHKDMVKAASRHFEEVELSERELDPTETKEKERLVKGLKKSAGDFKKRYGARAKSVMYATATKMAKERMDTSKSDRRYAVER